jgi:7-carboxy-7-deazaguanine synthase
MKQAVKRFRVAEIFGPTVQGEGRHVGVPCHFVRFGGCDYKCAWCDSLHAVLPEYVKLLDRLTVNEIVSKVMDLDPVEWVVFSGGNPALFDLMDPMMGLQEAGYLVMVETQGTMYRPWLAVVDELCVSPKGPSAKIGTALESLDRLDSFMRCQGIRDHHNLYFKIPIFNEDDYEFARAVRIRFPKVEMFLSIGNPYPPRGVTENGTSRPVLRAVLLDRTNQVIKQVLQDPEPLMKTVRIFPQQHVLLWGNDRGR